MDAINKHDGQDYSNWYQLGVKQTTQKNVYNSYFIAS